MLYFCFYLSFFCVFFTLLWEFWVGVVEESIKGCIVGGLVRSFGLRSGRLFIDIVDI